MRKVLGRIAICLTIILMTLAVIVGSQIPFSAIDKLPGNINISKQAVEELNAEKPFGKFISLKLEQINQADAKGLTDESILNIKLFNIFTIKSLKVAMDNVEVYACGNPVGFSLNSEGVIVIGNSGVVTEDGTVNTLEKSDIKNGDILLEIGDEKINKVTDINMIINREDNQNKELNVLLKRKDKIITTKIKPVLDSQSNSYRLGLWVKDDSSGVGTLTYIRKDNSRFGALGHAICDTDTKLPFNVNSGDMYNCTVIGLKKGLKGKPGEIKGLFIQGKNSLGTVDKNTKYGVFGRAKTETTKITDNKELLEAGGRLTAKPGKAIIRTSLDGSELKDYNIEIIKANYQNTSNEKSMVIRVTDRELLNKTGGIIQGMSGSPIIQNGRVVGAVTHVFVSDPTKGFGVYLDWMINE